MKAQHVSLAVFHKQQKGALLEVHRSSVLTPSQLLHRRGVSHGKWVT